jgi:DNA-binding SARP family transcriptional activator
VTFLCALPPTEIRLAFAFPADVEPSHAGPATRIPSRAGSGGPRGIARCQLPVDVCVRLLGRFELTCDGEVAIDGGWKPAKAAAIIKILALREGRSMLREQLIEALWPEADAEAGANSLYKNLHQLRKTVRRAGGPRDVIHLDHPLIALAPYVRVDLDEFRRRAESIDAASTREELEHAAALAGPLLPDDIYEPWTELYRTSVHMQITRVRLQLARAHVVAKSLEQAIEQYEAVLKLDDLCEEAQHGLVRAYMGCERRDLALRQYEHYRALLATELGTAPSPEVEALVADIRRESVRSRASEAVDEAVRDGDDAMRRRAYSDAVRLYREAIDGLQAAKDDAKREAELWLKLARATSAIGTQVEIAECCRRAAKQAERAGEFHLLADALVQFQDATDSTPGNNAGHREAAELIESALARLPPDEHAARALLLAAGARPVAAAERPENEQYVTGRLSIAGGLSAAIVARLREAVALARRSGDLDVLAYALTRLRVYITSPDTLDERLELTREMIEITRDGHHPINQYQAQLFRHEDLLEAGDIDGARIQTRAMRRLGEEIDASGILAIAYSLQATHDTADGPLAEAGRSLRQSREAEVVQGTTSNTQNRLGAQLLALRWHEGRIGEMESGYRRAVDVFLRMMNARAALAFI